MYANEEDLYGDELEGDEDRNDGLNALVKLISKVLESLMGYWN